MALKLYWSADRTVVGAECVTVTVVIFEIR